MKWKRYLGIGAVCLVLAGSIGFLNKKRTERLEEKAYKEQERLEQVLEDRREKEIKEVYDGLDEKTKELVKLTEKFIKEDGKRQVCEKVGDRNPKELGYHFNEACNNNYESVKKSLDEFIHSENQGAFKEFFKKYVFFNHYSDSDGGYIQKYFGPKIKNSVNITTNIFDKDIEMTLIQFRQLVDTSEEYSQGAKKDWSALQVLYAIDPENLKMVYINLDNLEKKAVRFWRKCELIKSNEIKNEKDKIQVEICEDLWKEAIIFYSDEFKRDKNLAFIYAYRRKNIIEDCVNHEGSHIFGFNDKHKLDDETYARLSALANNPSKFMIFNTLIEHKKIEEMLEKEGYSLIYLIEKNPDIVKKLVKKLIY